jgi:hypothetical protein
MINLKERVERVKGIEPSYAAWEAAVLPLNYTRIAISVVVKERLCQAAHDIN